MIDFRREGTKVKITIDSGVLNYQFTFYHDCAQDYHANLMSEAYQKHMRSKLERIRSDSYHQGWKDAKAKNKKETWFSGWW